MKKKLLILLSALTILASFSSVAFAGDRGHVPPEPIRDSIIIEEQM